MRHLVGFFLLSGSLFGCSQSEVGAMDPVDGGQCDHPTRMATGKDGCTECICDDMAWVCNSDACDTTPPDPCMPGSTGVAADGCSPCTCAMDGTWDCELDTGCSARECTPGDTKLGEGECYRCECDETGRWDCPDIECMKCTPGESSVAPCLSCICNEQGTWSCNIVFDGACAEECTPGDTFPADDGCNTCTCGMDGVPSCTARQCVPLVCDMGKGDCDGDPSNGCEVDLSSSVTDCGSCGLVCMAAASETAVCTAGQCSRVTEVRTCLYEGVPYAPGATFPSRDGCNTCTCDETEESQVGVSCTEAGCPCNPDAETRYRYYAAADPEACESMMFACPEHTQSFSNLCGCGCEQSVECPVVYSCVTEAGCSDFRERCPYTEIVAAVPM